MTSQDKDANAVTPKARVDDAVYFGVHNRHNPPESTLEALRDD